MESWLISGSCVPAELLYLPLAECRSLSLLQWRAPGAGTMQVFGLHWEVGALGDTHTFPDPWVTAHIKAQLYLMLIKCSIAFNAHFFRPKLWALPLELNPELSWGSMRITEKKSHNSLCSRSLAISELPLPTSLGSKNLVPSSEG